LNNIIIIITIIINLNIPPKIVPAEWAAPPKSDVPKKLPLENHGINIGITELLGL
jgi:hypothetical protein